MASRRLFIRSRRFWFRPHARSCSPFLCPVSSASSVMWASGVPTGPWGVAPPRTVPWFRVGTWRMVAMPGGAHHHGSAQGQGRDHARHHGRAPVESRMNNIRVRGQCQSYLQSTIPLPSPSPSPAPTLGDPGFLGTSRGSLWRSGDRDSK